jgi:hypothetical protein
VKPPSVTLLRHYTLVESLVKNINSELLMALDFTLLPQDSFSMSSFLTIKCCSLRFSLVMSLFFSFHRNLA